MWKEVNARIWKEVKVIVQHLTGEIEEHHRKPQSG
jgi:hypothetical protein